MIWRKLSDYSIQSPEGYRVCMTGTGDRARYTAWSPEKWQGFTHKPIGTYKRAGNAKRACERHWQKQADASQEAA